MNTQKNPFASRSFRIVLGVLAAIIGAAVFFEAGMYVGFHRAAFSYHWNEMYFRGPGDPHSVFAPFMSGEENPNPFGAAGEIVSVHLPEIMVKGPSEAEKVVVVGPDTVIRHIRGTGTSTDLAPGTDVIVVGKPDDQGEIRATFIRIVPGTSTEMLYNATMTPPYRH